MLFGCIAWFRLLLSNYYGMSGSAFPELEQGWIVKISSVSRSLITMMYRKVTNNHGPLLLGLLQYWYMMSVFFILFYSAGNCKICIEKPFNLTCLKIQLVLCLHCVWGDKLSKFVMLDTWELLWSSTRPNDVKDSAIRPATAQQFIICPYHKLAGFYSIDMKNGLQQLQF